MEGSSNNFGQVELSDAVTGSVADREVPGNYNKVVVMVDMLSDTAEGEACIAEVGLVLLKGGLYC